MVLVPIAATPGGDIFHLLWKCKSFDSARFLGDEALRRCNPDLLPEHLLLGIPGQFTADFNFHLCDQTLDPGSPLLQLPRGHPLAFDYLIKDDALLLLEKFKDAALQMTAQQFIDSLRTTGEKGDFPVACACSLLAPALPNI